MGDDLNMSIHPLTVRDGDHFYTDERPRPENYNPDSDMKGFQYTDDVLNLD